MKVKPPTLILYGDGRHDDTVAMNAFFAGKRVWNRTGGLLLPLQRDGGGARLPPGNYVLSSTVHVPSGPPVPIRESFFRAAPEFPAGSVMLEFSPEARFSVDLCFFDRAFHGKSHDRLP